MEYILSHPIGPLPWSLPTPDGMLRKVAAALQKNVAVAEQLPENTASVIDGMNLVQRVKGEQSTFGNVATTVLLMALNEERTSNRIDVVLASFPGFPLL